MIIVLVAPRESNNRAKLKFYDDFSGKYSKKFRNLIVARKKNASQSRN